MNLIRCWEHRNPPPVYSIAEAVNDMLVSDASGMAERAVDTARKAVEFLAALTQTLHENGVLPDNDVLLLLPGFQETDTTE